MNELLSRLTATECVLIGISIYPLFKLIKHMATKLPPKVFSYYYWKHFDNKYDNTPSGRMNALEERLDCRFRQYHNTLEKRVIALEKAAARDK